MSVAAFPNQVIRASAGSGKTHQLTNRYLGLLAAGVDADAILATTFTRKAAGEILDRVLKRLAEAAADGARAKQLAVDIQAPADTPAAFVALLRRMLSRLHVVRIGTLDSFTIALARHFSLELGLPAGWAICEESDDEALREEALELLLGREEAAILTGLYQRLTQGQTKHGVQRELLDVVKRLYGIYPETVPEDWNKVTVKEGLAPAKLRDLLAGIAAFDLFTDVRMQKARDEDLERFGSDFWEKLLDTGLCAKVLSGQNTYHSKPIPEELIALYVDLIRHVRHVLVLPVAEQTQATGEFLAGFHRELQALKQATGALRFDDVTQALVEAIRRNEWSTEALAFRLDGAIEHLLLDEFQDTSLAQWEALRPIARRVAQPSAEPPRSFFAVGDVKQAIFGWRGGMAGLFNILPDALGPLKETALVQSQRSAQPIIDVVNRVFGGLGQVEMGEKCRDGLNAWAGRFRKHTTVKEDVRGYVCLATGPAQAEDQDLAEQRGLHYHHVAEKIRTLIAKAQGAEIGVLCRTNNAVARMIFELRQLKIDASEEGGNPLTDSPAVELLLSLFTLADHPGHSVAWFHLQNSPLKEHLAPIASAETLASRLRRDLLVEGYGTFTYGWAKLLAPACNYRDLGRLQQLVERAYAYQERSTLRADDFVRWVRQDRVPDPSGAKVRVMTVHAAKGLQFDAVVLPELDARLIGQAPAFVVGRDPNSLVVNFVCRYANETVQALLTPEERSAFEQQRQQGVEESLSLLYVAMTRAKQALYLFIPGPRQKSVKDAWYQLLRQRLAPGAPETPAALLYEHGNAAWFGGASAAPEAPPAAAPVHIAFRTAETERRRGLEHMAPSHREGQARVALDRLFHPSEGTGLTAGTIYHAWFARIGWLEDGLPGDDELRDVAEKECLRQPAAHWPDLDPLLANFRAWLQDPRIAAVLQRSAYASSKNPGFPPALRTLAMRRLRVQKLEQERRFLVPDGPRFWTGSFDRIVWLNDGDQTVAADVIDYKTDALTPGDAAALAARIEHYRPQLEAYRQAAARLARVPPDRIAARLVFTVIGQVAEV